MAIGMPTVLLYYDLQQKGYLNQPQKVVELGSQDIALEQQELMKSVVAELFGVKIPQSNLLNPRTIYQSMGFKTYKCIDADGRHDALVFDLNKDLQKNYGYSEKFDLVTNHGTTEHCFDQYHCWQNIHNLCSTGGIMIHVLPTQGYVNHGMYKYEPSFFYNLAAANQYKLLAIYFGSNRTIESGFYNFNLGLTIYTEEIFQSLSDLPDTKDISLYVVLQKMIDSSFATPYDVQFLANSLLPAKYLEQSPTENIIASEFMAEMKQANQQFRQYQSTPTYSALTSLPTQIEQTQAKLQQVEAQLNVANAEIAAMKTSKFWKLREQWLKLKKILGFPSG
jgi:hypothetical protein